MKSPNRAAIRSLVGALALGVAVCFAAPALAQPNQQNQQNQNELRAPTPSPPRNPPSHLWGMLFAIFLGGLVIGVNFLPSKRGHQD